jgi:predicted PurR-regulated permease PerM
MSTVKTPTTSPVPPRAGTASDPPPAPTRPSTDSRRAPPDLSSPTFRRILVLVGVALLLGLAYLLRGVLIPLFFAFLLAYALDPFVDWLEARRVPRGVAAPLVMLAIAGAFSLVLVYAIPLFLDELRSAATDLPNQLKRLEERLEPWLAGTFKLKLPHTMSELTKDVGDRLQAQFPNLMHAASVALFGTLSYVAVILSALIVPVFALYLLIDFDRIVTRTGQLVPRRWFPTVREVARQIHKTLGGYVRGQLTANIVLGALYATGLRIVDIRLAVPIGVLTGMLAFVPYIGFSLGLTLAVGMAALDWDGPGKLVGVVAVMLGVQILDGLVVTPRIVGRSVGLAPLEVLLTMMAAGSLFGFLGVLLAVPLGAVVKILVQRAVTAYLASDFYSRAAEK